MKSAILLLPLLVACTASLTPEQARVRVTTDPKAADGCRRVGNVTGGSQWEDEAFREVQRYAAKIGGDTVVLTFQTPDGRTKRGEVFKCSQP